ncbi:MAG: AMP-dependent synthetase and ligase, partial [Ilumatobacteraceae bacterium]|nr:AMP-dependent synthetase and ligase [Ilumatobacteraceae bacterium]
IMYTSGTTARPKGVMFSHGNLRTAALTAVTHFRWTKNDRFLHYFPLFHANGGLYGVFPALMSQASIMMVPKFSASAFGSQLHDLGITFTSVNATHVKMIMNHPVSPRDAEHQTWRMMLGLTLRPDEITAFENRFATRLCPTYGLTEGLGIDAIGEPVGPRRVGSAGRLLRGYKLRVVDESGTELPAGERGEAEFASELEHGVPMGYFRDPEKTAEIYRDGWVRTGDVLEMDADGYLWFVERKRDMIKRSGYNVAPAEVERVIAAVAGVADVAVVGAPDEMREEAIIAYVVADAGAVVTPELVLAACTTTLADYKVPQVVEIIDALPRNFLGKIERKVLRERALEHRVVATARPVSGA